MARRFLALGMENDPDISVTPAAPPGRSDHRPAHEATGIAVQSVADHRYAAGLLDGQRRFVVGRRALAETRRSSPQSVPNCCAPIRLDQNASCWSRIGVFKSPMQYAVGASLLLLYWSVMCPLLAAGI